LAYLLKATLASSYYLILEARMKASMDEEVQCSETFYLLIANFFAPQSIGGAKELVVLL